MSVPEAFVAEASLVLDRDCDPGAPGAAVTVELCGHWEHEGPCRWPHNSALDAQRDPAALRTIFVAEATEAEAIRARIERALRTGERWRVVDVGMRPLNEAEDALAQRLLAAPRAQA
jgi:hypothetical protein